MVSVPEAALNVAGSEPKMYSQKKRPLAVREEAIWLLVIGASLVLPAHAQESRQQKLRAIEPSVRLVYLIPSDRSYRKDYAAAIKHAIENLQVWYQDQMGNSKTFDPTKPVAVVIDTDHTAVCYSE